MQGLLNLITTMTGQVAQVSGVYSVDGTSYQVTLIKGDRVPPYMGMNARYTLVLAARHHLYG